jgi:hypothetical protein
LVIEHYAHPEELLQLRAQVFGETAREATNRFADAAGLISDDIL